MTVEDAAMDSTSGVATRSADAIDPMGPRSPLAWLVLGVVHLYRATATFRSPRCRFHPSCSSYALQAVRIHGGLRGTMLAVRRLGRCHPWNPGGVDHVPQRK